MRVWVILGVFLLMFPAVAEEYEPITDIEAMETTEELNEAQKFEQQMLANRQKHQRRRSKRVTVSNYKSGSGSSASKSSASGSSASRTSYGKKAILNSSGGVGSVSNGMFVK